MGLVKQILEFYEAVDDWCKVQPDESNGIPISTATWRSVSRRLRMVLSGIPSIATSG